MIGHSPAGVRALANLQRACARWLPGRYHIEVIDLVENPRQAAEDEVVAVPTLVRKHPLPIRKIVGDLADTERLLFAIRKARGDYPLQGVGESRCRFAPGTIPARHCHPGSL